MRETDPNNALENNIIDADHRVSVNEALVKSRVGDVNQRRLFESAIIELII